VNLLTFRASSRSAYFPTRRSSDLTCTGWANSPTATRWTCMGKSASRLASHLLQGEDRVGTVFKSMVPAHLTPQSNTIPTPARPRSEEHTSELQSRENIVCRLLLEK